MSIEIFVNDLKEISRLKVLEFYGFKSVEEGNLDINPLFILEKD